MDEDRLAISDKLWEQMGPLLPGKVGDPGATGRDNRRFMEAVLWRVRTGSPWRDLPKDFGNWNSVFKRFRRWADAGVFESLFNAATLRAHDQLVQALRLRIAKLQKQAFGASSEKIEREIEQLELALEDLLVAVAEAEDAALDEDEVDAPSSAASEPVENKSRRRPRVSDTTPREALDRIGKFYDIEHEIAGQSADTRLAARQKSSKPKVDAFRLWAEHQLTRIPGKSDLAKAFRYGLSRWPSFCLFLEDGRVAIDNNAAERAMRPIEIGRKNWLFAGADTGAETLARAMTIIETAKLNAIDPQAYLADVLDRIHDHKINRIDELLPWNWAPA